MKQHIDYRKDALENDYPDQTDFHSGLHKKLKNLKSKSPQVHTKHAHTVVKKVYKIDTKQAIDTEKQPSTRNHASLSPHKAKTATKITLPDSEKIVQDTDIVIQKKTLLNSIFRKYYIAVAFIVLLVLTVSNLSYSYYLKRKDCLKIVDSIKVEMAINSDICNQGVAFQNTNNVKNLLVFKNQGIYNLQKDFESRQKDFESIQTEYQKKFAITLFLTEKQLENKSDIDVNKTNGLLLATQHLQREVEKLDNLQVEFQEKLNSEVKSIEQNLAEAKKENFDVKELIQSYNSEKINLLSPITTKLDAKKAKDTYISLEKIDGELSIQIQNYRTLKEQSEQQNLQSLVSGKLPTIPQQEDLSKITLSSTLAIQDNSSPDCDIVNCIALTFDDGPSDTLTPKLLDVLKERKTKATFFAVGSNISKYPDIGKRVVSEGHEIGNHSWSHSDLTKLNDQKINQEIDSTNQIIIQATGVAPKVFRPPYGSINIRVKNAVKMPLILWSVDTKDWRDRDSQVVAKRTVVNAKKGQIVLLHDIHPTTVEATKLILDTLIKNGYYFVTVSELLGNDLNNSQTYFSR